MFSAICSLLKGTQRPAEICSNKKSKDIIAENDIIHEYFWVPNKLDLDHCQQMEVLREVRKLTISEEFYRIYEAEYMHTIFYELQEFGINPSDLQEYENKFSVLMGYSVEFKEESFGIKTQEEDFFFVPNLFSEKYGPAYDELRLSRQSYYSLSSNNKSLLQEVRGVFYALLSIVKEKIISLSNYLKKKEIEKLYKHMNLLKENTRFWKEIVRFVIERRTFISKNMGFSPFGFVPSLEESRMLGALIMNFYFFF